LVKGLTGWRGVSVFVAFNLAIFASGVFLSYLRHDPFGQALEEAERALRKARRDRDVANRLLELHGRQVAAIRGRLAELRAWGEEEFTKAKHHGHTQRNFYERLMHEYAGANKAARTHPDEPVRILDDPDLWDVPTMPPDLTADSLDLWRPTDELGLPQAIPAIA
jgi:hypothetical protein